VKDAADRLGGNVRLTPIIRAPRASAKIEKPEQCHPKLEKPSIDDLLDLSSQRSIRTEKERKRIGRDIIPDASHADRCNAVLNTARPSVTECR
jgi:hypothetical protein